MEKPQIVQEINYFHPHNNGLLDANLVMTYYDEKRHSPCQQHIQNKRSGTVSAASVLIGKVPDQVLTAA